MKTDDIANQNQSNPPHLNAALSHNLLPLIFSLLTPQPLKHLGKLHPNQADAILAHPEPFAQLD